MIAVLRVFQKSRRKPVLSDMSPLKCWLSKQASFSLATVNKCEKLCLYSELGVSPNKEPIWFQRETFVKAISKHNQLAGCSGGEKLLLDLFWMSCEDCGCESRVHVQSDCSLSRDEYWEILTRAVRLQRNIMKAFYLNAKSRRGRQCEKSLHIQDVETINFPVLQLTAENHRVSLKVWNEPECSRAAVSQWIFYSILEWFTSVLQIQTEADALNVVWIFQMWWLELRDGLVYTD